MPKSHSFVVRIWLEERNQDGSHWRGHITHVISGQRRYLDDLDVIPDFIATYLSHLERYQIQPCDGLEGKP